MNSNPYDNNPYGSGPGGSPYSSGPTPEHGSYDSNPFGDNSQFGGAGGQPGNGDNPYENSPYGVNPFSSAPSAPTRRKITEKDYRGTGQKPPLSQPLYGASPVTAYTRFWKKFARFKGYASPSEYWWPQLINTLICFVLFVPGIVAVIMADIEAQRTSEATGYEVEPDVPALAIIGTLVSFLFLLVAAVPTLSSGWRRIQDAGMHGALIFLAFIPYLGGLINIVLCILPTKLTARQPGRDDLTGD